jgi:probable HAF family extracellular repeat protein
MRCTGIHCGALLAALSGCLPALAVTPALPSYTTHLIPVPSNATTLTPMAINNLGDVTGAIEFANQVSHAFLYSGGVVTDLGTLTYPGTTTLGGAVGLAINNTGDVVGTYGDQVGQTWSYGFEYSSGTMTALSGATGYPLCSATAVNDPGTIVGGCQSLNGSFAAVYSQGVPQPIGPAGGLGGAINVYGQVAAYSATSAFIYNSGVVTNLPSLTTTSATPPPVPTAMNNAGQVVGWQSINGTYTPFLYSNGTMTPVAMAQLAPSTVTPTVYINNAGTIVGATVATAGATATPYLVSDTIMFNINALISASDPSQPYVTITNAYQINDLGWILVSGFDSRTQATGAYVLIPTAPLPLDAALLAPASAVVGSPFTVAWTDQSASSCTAAGGSGMDGWSGSLATNGGQQQVTEMAAATYDFSLSCAGASGSITATTKVVVASNVTPGFTNTGSGALDLRTLAALLMLCALRVLRALRN